MLFDDLAICFTLKTSASMNRHFKYVHHLNENTHCKLENLSSNPFIKNCSLWALRNSFYCRFDKGAIGKLYNMTIRNTNKVDCLFFFPHSHFLKFERFLCNFRSKWCNVEHHHGLQHVTRCYSLSTDRSLTQEQRQHGGTKQIYSR